jgi:hypothetical protein
MEKNMLSVLIHFTEQEFLNAEKELLFEEGKIGRFYQRHFSAFPLV